MRHSSLVLLLVPAFAAAQDIPLSQILVEKEGWKPVAQKLPGITSLSANAKGVGIYQGNALTHWLDASGALRKADSDAPFAPTDRGIASVEAAVDGKKFIERFHVDAKTKTVRSSVREQSLKLPGMTAPTCLAVWPDGGHLVVGEEDGGWLWAIRIEVDGRFGPGDRYYSLRTRPDIPMRVAAMVLDAEFLLYACTPIGVQVFDPTGRLSGVLGMPAKEAMKAITIGGARDDQLFVAAGNTIFARKIQKKAAYTRP